MDAEGLPSVSEAVACGDPLPALVDVLVSAIDEVDDAQVPPLAARLVDVLRRIGGTDLSVLEDLRDGLARAVDRLARLQGMTDLKTGRPLGTALAPMIRQLLEVLDALDAATGAMPVEGSPLDEIAAARARRRADRTARAAGM